MAERQRVTLPPDGTDAAFLASPRVLGLDIGGTASRARLCKGPRIVAQSHAPSASLPAAGLDGARAALAELLAGLPLEHAEPLDAVCAGSAGLSVPGAREFLQDALAPLARPGRVVIVSDAMLVLPAAGVDSGIAVICGTGSIAVGSNDGRAVQVGGWGYLLGDEASGYWIVREAVRELLARRDRGRPLGELGEQLVPATGAADLGALHRHYLEQPHRPRQWAQYAELVLASSDPAAANIRARAASAVADLAAEAMAQLALPPDSPGPDGDDVPARFPALLGGVPGGLPVVLGGVPGGLPVVLGGGLFASEAFGRATRAALARRLPESPVSVLAAEPVAGAVRLASRAAALG